MFLLLRKSTGSYQLYVNGFRMPDFFVDKNILPLIQRWEDSGKLQIMDDIEEKVPMDQVKEELVEKLLEKFNQIVEE